MKKHLVSTSVKLLLAALIALPVLQTAKASTNPTAYGECGNGITELKKKKKKKKKKSHSSDHGGGDSEHSGGGDGH